MVIVTGKAKRQKVKGIKTHTKCSFVLLNITQLCHSLRNGVIEMSEAFYQTSQSNCGERVVLYLGRPPTSSIIAFYYHKENCFLK
jgi:hypothetical protein